MGRLEDTIKRLREAAEPYRAVADVGGQGWDIVSNGYVAIGTRTDALPSGHEKFGAFWLRVIDEPGIDAGETTADAIREWVGPYSIEPVYRTCMECSGSGLHECGCGHEHKCGYCEGEGKVEGSAPPNEGRWSWHREDYWDRNLVGFAIHGAEGPVVWKVLSSTTTFGSVTNYLVLACSDRVAVIAGLAHGMTEQEPFIGRKP
jgi:hypothetical protein